MRITDLKRGGMVYLGVCYDFYDFFEGNERKKNIFTSVFKPYINKLSFWSFFELQTIKIKVPRRKNLRYWKAICEQGNFVKIFEGHL